MIVFKEVIGADRIKNCLSQGKGKTGLNMGKIWVNIDPWDKDMVTTALEGGADALVLPDGHADDVKALGKITTIAMDGDLVPDKDVVFFTIKSGADEDEILQLSKDKKVILICTDWTIIPLENLIAKGADVIVKVHTEKEAQTAFGILEKGVGTVLFHPKDVTALKTALSTLSASVDAISLKEAQILDITPVGMGDRVCVDTCTSMIPGQGMLVGNSSSALFLVHAESLSNPYVAPRPFRVNAGPVHAYTRVADGKTRYLSELASGDPVLICDHQGHLTESIVGRLKIEKRPLMLIRAKAGDTIATAIVQNAETIRLDLVDLIDKGLLLKIGDKKGTYYILK